MGAIDRAMPSFHLPPSFKKTKQGAGVNEIWRRNKCFRINTTLFNVCFLCESFLLDMVSKDVSKLKLSEFSYYQILCLENWPKLVALKMIFWSVRRHSGRNYCTDFLRHRKRIIFMKKNLDKQDLSQTS